MKISQMKFQKIVVKAAVIVAAISLFYAVAVFASQLYHFVAVDATDDGTMDVSGWALFNDVQGFNKALFTLTLIHFLVSLTLLVFFCQSRRNYYLSNYIVTGVTTATSLGVGFYALINIIIYMVSYVSIDFNSINTNEGFLEATNGAQINAFPWSFIIGIIIYVGMLALAVCLVINAFWKRKDMIADKKEHAEEDARIRAEWARKEQELKMEAEKYES